MSWPLSQDYNEAIQDPRSSFADAELRAGETITNALGIPMPRSGNFADVYEMRCRSGARWAVKCFTREIHGLRERYAEISNYLHRVNLPFMVDFRYLEQGIRIRGQWYPILKMQWVEGFVLNQFVRDNLDKKPILHALGQIWLRMARRLREARLAHGDLQHGNVMFVPSNSAHALAVKLIDYDGMCVPSLAGRNSGEVGHPAYQHPERLRSGTYNPEIDRFSLLSISAALRCLMVGGRSLWERYDTGDNLLFRQSDLQAAEKSPLFHELRAIGDPQVQLLVNALYRACQGQLAGVPLLTDILPVPQHVSSRSRIAVASEAVAVPQTEWDWDFGEPEPGTPSIRKHRTSTGIPMWAWGALGGAAALLLSVGVITRLFPLQAPAEKARTSAAKNRLEIMPSRKAVNSAASGEQSQPAQKQTAWWSPLDLPPDLEPDAADAALRVPVGRTIATRQEYSGPLDITIVERGPLEQDVSFIAPGGAMVTFRSRHTGPGSHLLNVRRPDKSDSEFGTLVGSKPIALPDSKWSILHWRITPTGMTIAINRHLLFQEEHNYDLSANYPVKIRVNRETIEVKSVVVKSLEN